MTLRKKTLLIVSATLWAVIAALYATSRVVLLGSFAELEQREAQRNVERVLSAVADDLSGVDQACRNAATWDKAYAFIRNASPGFVKSEIGSGAYSDLAARRLHLRCISVRPATSSSARASTWRLRRKHRFRRV